MYQDFTFLSLNNFQYNSDLGLVQRLCARNYPTLVSITNILENVWHLVIRIPEF